MLDAVAHSNCLAVAVAAVAYYLLGAAWFTPLFGKAWDRSIGYDRSRDTTFGPAYYVVPLVSTVLVALALGVILAALAPTFGEALIVGVVVGLGVAAVSINNALTPHTPHPYVFGAVTGGYHLVGIVLVSAIIGAFPN
ncbi:DUF1761 family protein [Gordonia pseudamarae]|jgi:MFS family permease|uniref:DUF1761 family protein n=1 Tax=Gordonia pseudamarae TaxID=2831662 RepID=A0ABX6IC00_9ACTN|nr:MULTISPECIES: DUF1761 domain-containing protein [Gordonia]MBD0024218.1 DUF1761 domain-containing protein [Gordonia sp. (in: high G+C Gram-positive bacteria)]QHN24610.1 DUF1761 family protein [Gordonia pseudamarae]QHN33541.1 DUF1761 family protein [Gordonia pseudamarae]